MGKTRKNFLKMALIRLLCIILAFSGGILRLGATEQTAGIKALIVTGRNSHNWQESSRALKKVLEETGLFKVDLEVCSPEGESLRTFDPDFIQYRVVVLDYYGENWPDRTQRAFVEYVQKGGGVVVFHNAGNAFRDWPEYLKIIGLGGGGRSNESGPYIYWDGAGTAEDDSEGSAGDHTYGHEFSVQIRNSSHPITAGLPQVWVHAQDELYGLLRGRSDNLRILATAYSDIHQKGTGRHEPVLFINSFGRGRIFQTTLGHVSGEGPYPAIECVGFIVTMQRGAEWAATGRVTQDIPADFPEQSHEITAAADIRRWPDCEPPSLDGILEELVAYEYGQDNEVLSRLRAFVLSHKNRPESRLVCETRLTAFLKSKTSLASKMEVCRHLRLIGTAVSVPALEDLLLSEDTCDMARFSLEKIPGEEAENALLRGLSTPNKMQKLGIISSLGQREDVSAVQELSTLLSDPDQEIRMAAARALGRIGGQQAARILSLAMEESGEEFGFQLASSLLNCADKFLDEGDSGQAGPLYEQLTGTLYSKTTRIAAWRGLIAADKERGKSILFDLLKESDSDLHMAAISRITGVLNDDDMPELLAALSQLPADSRVAVLHILPHYPHKTVLPAVLEAAESDLEIIQVSALQVLQRIGDASVVPLLAGFASRGRGNIQKEARESLRNLSGSQVDKSILLLLMKTSDPLLQRELIRCLSERRIEGGKPILFHLVLNSQDPRIRQEACRNLDRLVDPSDIPRLLDLLIASGGEAERTGLRRAVASASSGIPTGSSRGGAVRERLLKIEDERSRAELYRVMGSIGDRSLLPLLRSALKREDTPVYDGAVRAFIEWPDSSVKDDLLWIASSGKNPLYRTLALRACLGMAGRDRYQRPASAVGFLERGLDLAERKEEKALVLALLPRFICTESLELAVSLLSDNSVRGEARLAFNKILYDLLKAKCIVFH